MSAPAVTRAPLSPGQERLWVAEQVAPGRSGYVVQRVLRLDGPLDVAVLRAAVTRLVERHGVLRTTYRELGGVAQQVRSDRAPDVFAVVTAGEDAVDGWAHRRRREPFHLDADPPLRVDLLRVAAERHVLVITVHHIAIDGWSLRVLLEELAELHNALAARREARLPPAPDFIAHALRARRSPPGDADLRFWRAALSGIAPVTGPPPDHAPPVARSDAAHARPVRLSRRACLAVADAGRRARCTPFVTLLACWGAALHLAGAADDLVVAIPVAGRGAGDDRRLVGFLVNVLPIRIRCDELMTFSRVLDGVRAAALGAVEHAAVPYERIVAAARAGRRLGRAQLAQAAYDLNPPPPLPRLDGLRCAERPAPPVSARFELELHLTFSRADATGHVLAAADLFTAESAELVADVFTEVASRWPGEPATPLGRLLPAVDEERP